MSSRFQDVERTERIKEYIRLKLHTYIVTALTGINVLILFPLGFLTWITSLAGTYTFSWFHEMSWFWFIVLWNLPLFTWNYSTITIPIKKGFKEIIDWWYFDFFGYLIIFPQNDFSIKSSGS